MKKVIKFRKWILNGVFVSNNKLFYNSFNFDFYIFDLNTYLK